jgi:hypothetical protein
VTLSFAFAFSGLSFGVCVTGAAPIWLVGRGSARAVALVGVSAYRRVGDKAKGTYKGRQRKKSPGKGCLDAPPH